MIGRGDADPAQQTGIGLVAGCGFAGAGARDQRLDPHHAHQPLHALAVDAVAGLVEFEHHSPRAVKRPLQMQLVDPPEDQLDPIRTLGTEHIDSTKNGSAFMCSRTSIASPSIPLRLCGAPHNRERF